MSFFSSALTRRFFGALLAAGAALAMAGTALAQGRDATPSGFTGKVFVNEGGGVRIHTYMADPKGAMVTTHIIEGQSGLIMVDALFVADSAKEVRRYVDSLGKPVERLYISHEHPDHWFGLHHFGHMPVHTGPLTAKFLTERAAQMIARNKADSSPPQVGGVVTEGPHVVAGVTLNISMIRDAEAAEELIIEVPAVGAIIVQDFVYNNIHAFVTRNLDNWIQALEGLEKRTNDKTIVLAGHGEPTGQAAFGEMKVYLRAVKPLLLTNIGKPEQADAIVKEMADKFPNRRMPSLLKWGLSFALPN